MPATIVARLSPGGTIIDADRVDAAIRTERAYCTTCGWVLPAGARPTCAACGGDPTPLPLVDNTRPIPHEDEDDAALASAREAWAAGEHARAMGLALALTASPRAFASPYGQGWVAVVGSTPVFAFLDPASSQVTLEVPVARLPQAKRVPALRAALALCNESRVASRLCLRLDLLVARFVARLDSLSPLLVRKIARELAATARRAEEHLAAAFDARPAIPEHGLLSAWDRVGRSLPLALLAPSSVAGPPPPSSPSSMRPSSRPSGRPSAPSPLLDPPAKAITLRLSIPPVLAPDLDEDDLPAVLAPDYADVPPSPPAARPPSIPPSSRPSLDDTPSMRPSMLPSALPNVPVLGLRTPFPSTSAMRAVPPPAPDPDAPPPSRRPVRPPPPDTMSPEGRLCELLRQALGLATALSFEERPHTMLLLVRAAVFRAVHEHHAAVPNAVAYLYRATRTVTREVWSSKLDPGRAAAIPVAEPALGALEQILAARASIPKEKPVTIDPWTSAQQAKENLSRYLAEIEIAPPDPTLRHYLALGALSELLARTRLPAPTDQRLRDIVAYAQRDGAKPHVIELMMTALRKIVAG